MLARLLCVNVSDAARHQMLVVALLVPCRAGGMLRWNLKSSDVYDMLIVEGYMNTGGIRLC